MAEIRITLYLISILGIQHERVKTHQRDKPEHFFNCPGF